MIAAVKRKELRGFLLKFLEKVYPENISRESIFETFYEYWQTDDMMDELQYLVEKGYVDEHITKSPFLSFNLIHNYKLTAMGKDLLDGTIEDPGVYVKEA